MYLEKFRQCKVSLYKYRCVCVWDKRVNHLIEHIYTCMYIGIYVYMEHIHDRKEVSLSRVSMYIMPSPGQSMLPLTE